MTLPKAVVVLPFLCGLLCAQEAPRDWDRLELRRGTWRGLPLRYKVQNGWALVEGDILLAPVEELEGPGPKAARRDASVLSGPDFRWPDGVIAYTQARDLARPERVREAINAWQAAAGLRFVERTTERDFVTIRSAASGCSATVGMRGGQQYVNLGEECSVGSIIHEFGHTIGLFHTQGRIDRDAYVRIRYDNLDKREWPQYDQHISDAEDVGGYDYGSIMHYSGAGFSRTLLPTIVTVPPGIPIGQRDRISPNDIRAVLRMYGRSPEAVTIDTNPAGLKIRIDGAALTAPHRVRWAAGERHTLAVDEIQSTGANSRAVFARWTNGGGREQTVTAGEEFVYTAQFAEQVRFRIAGPAAGGTVEVQPLAGDGFYPLGFQVQVKATPNAGYRFVRWTAGAGGTVFAAANGIGPAANPLTVPVTRDDLFYAARFTTAPVTVIDSEPPGRVVSVDGTRVTAPVAFEWTPATTHNLALALTQANPSESARFRFERWSQGGDPGQTVIATDRPLTTYTAVFQTQHLVTTDLAYLVSRASPDRPAPSSITISPPSPEGFYDAGQRIQVDAADGTGWSFANWFGDLTGPVRPKTVTVGDQMVVGANFLSPPYVYISGVVHDATRQPGPVTAGQALSIFRPGSGPEKLVEGGPEAGGWSTRLAGTRFLFDGVASEILAIGRDEADVIVPASAIGKKTVELTVEAEGKPTVSWSLPVLDRNPGIYTADFSGLGPAFAGNDDESPNSAGNPARQGSVFAFLATGLGETDSSARPLLPLQVLVSESEAEILGTVPYPDLPPGVFIVRARVPGNLDAGPQPLYLLSGGRASQPGVTLHVR